MVKKLTADGSKLKESLHVLEATVNIGEKTTIDNELRPNQVNMFCIVPR